MKKQSLKSSMSTFSRLYLLKLAIALLFVGFDFCFFQPLWITCIYYMCPKHNVQLKMKKTNQKKSLKMNDVLSDCIRVYGAKLCRCQTLVSAGQCCATIGGRVGFSKGSIGCLNWQFGKMKTNNYFNSMI